MVSPYQEMPGSTGPPARSFKEAQEKEEGWEKWESGWRLQDLQSGPRHQLYMELSLITPINGLINGFAWGYNPNLI